MSIIEAAPLKTYTNIKSIASYPCGSSITTLPTGYLGCRQPRTVVSGTTRINVGDLAGLQQFVGSPMNSSTQQQILSYLNAATISNSTSINISSSSTIGYHNGYITNYTVQPDYYNNTCVVDWTGEVSGNIGSDFELKSFDPKEQAKIKLKSNLLIKVKSRANDILLRDMPLNEQIAIETLRESISESEYRKYLKYGFILVPAKSGKVYQVFKNQSHVKVWKGGKLIEEICVKIKDIKIPPTDKLIAFKAMIRIDEEEFRKSGNLYKMAA